ATPCWEQGLGQGPPAPRIPAASLGPRAGTAPGPAVGGQRRHHRLHLGLAPAAPALFLTRDRQALRLGSLLPPHPPPPSSALDALAGHPGRGPLRVECAREPLACPLRLRRKRLRLGYARAWTARAIMRPGCGQREGTIQQGMALATGLGQQHPPLAVLKPPCRPTLWPRHTRRLLPLFEQPRLVKAPHRRPLPQV